MSGSHFSAALEIAHSLQGNGDQPSPRRRGYRTRIYRPRQQQQQQEGEGGGGGGGETRPVSGWL